MEERVETLVPLLYILIFLMAYFGPNGELIGNVKLTLWQYQAVTDINKFLENIFLLFAIDFSGAIFNALLLWKICKLNFLNTFKNIQKEFWLILGVQEASLFMTVIMIKKFGIVWDNSFVFYYYSTILVSIFLLVLIKLMNFHGYMEGVFNPTPH